MKTFVIGLGTGRCGTTSLAKLLDKQNNFKCTHEKRPVLAWDINREVGGLKLCYEKIDNFIYELLKRNNLTTIGDIALYYLPYVEYIYRYLLQKYTTINIKFICLKRNKEEVIKSFIAQQGDNFYFFKDNKEHKKKHWYKCFPKYSYEKREDAIGYYWASYYAQTELWEDAIPQTFRTFNTECLNTREGVQSILDFIEIPRQDQKIVVGIHTNSILTKPQ